MKLGNQYPSPVRLPGLWPGLWPGLCPGLDPGTWPGFCKGLELCGGSRLVSISTLEPSGLCRPAAATSMRAVKPGAPGHCGCWCSPLAALAVTLLALRRRLGQVPALALGRVPGQQQAQGWDAAPSLLWLRLPPLLLSSHSRWLMPARNMHIRQTLAAGAALAHVQLRVAMIKLVLA